MTSIRSLKRTFARAPRGPATRIVAPLFLAALSGCGEVAQQPVSAGTGPNPAMPAPRESLLPTVNIAPARGWPADRMPTPAPGTRVATFARDLDHPRWLLVLPDGSVLVAETNAPERPDDRKGIRGWVMQKVMKRAGAGVPSANRITRLADTDGDGVADVRSPYIEGLNSPFGMALIGDALYVANTDAVVRFPYTPGAAKVSGPGTRLTDLPAGALNHHWTKNLIASEDGRRLYVTVGSNSNVAENGIEAEEGRAAIWEVDVASGTKRLFATGLRNPNGMAWDGTGKTLWTVVNERDEIGSDLVPDYLTAVRDGDFYGWPYSYYGEHLDTRVKAQRPDRVARARVPDYALGPHTASLGLAWSAGNTFGPPFAQGMFIGQHGSWNRKPLSGYKVIFVPFAGNRPEGAPVDVLTGFVSADGDAYGRPVGVAIDRQGALLVADDVGNAIWRVTGAQAAPAGH